MNINEACKLNTLLAWLLPGASARDPHHQTTSAEASEAAAYLAERANKALSAGLDGKDVLIHWPQAASKRKAPKR